MLKNLHFISIYNVKSIKKSNLKISLLKKADWYSIPPKEVPASSKRAAFRIFRRASLTVEAAAVLPLFFLGILACISLMNVYALRMETTIGLQEQAEKLGMYAHAAPDLSGDGVVDLTERVRFHIPFFPAVFPDLEFDCRGRVRAWTGRQETDGAPGDGAENVMVYLTESGSVYHMTSRCSHLSLSIRQVTAAGVGILRNKDGGKYKACEKCVGRGEKNGLLYVTDQGDRYHNSLECSGLKRSVRLVSLDSLEGMACCSRCEKTAAAGAP